MTLFFYFPLNRLFARLRISKNWLNLFLEKMGKKQSFITEERSQIVTLSSLKFSVRQIAKNMKVRKTTVYNAIMKYQNEGFLIDRKRSGQPKFTTSKEDRLVRKVVT